MENEKKVEGMIKYTYKGSYPHYTQYLIKTLKNNKIEIYDMDGITKITDSDLLKCITNCYTVDLEFEDKPLIKYDTHKELEKKITSDIVND